MAAVALNRALIAYKSQENFTENQQSTRNRFYLLLHNIRWAKKMYRNKAQHGPFPITAPVAFSIQK